MKTQYFYRVQNEEGLGPYTNEDYSNIRSSWITKPHSPKNFNHGPNDCPVLRDVLLSTRMYFGFTTLKQLQTWFTPTELVNLYNKGYKITRVKGELVKASDFQAIFFKV